MTIFIIVSIVGALLLGFSLIFGEIFEAFDAIEIAPDGVLSGASIGGFFIGFGAVGSIVSNSTNLSILIVSLIALLGGLLLGGFAVGMTRFFKSQESDGSLTDTETLLGVQGTIIMGGKSGTLCSGRFPFNGATRDMSVRSDADLEAGQAVIVSTVLTHSSVKVEPLP